MTIKSLDRLLDTNTRTADNLALDPGKPRIPGLTILCHPDVDRIGEIAPLPELAAGRTVDLSRSTPYFAQPGAGDLQPLIDPFLSRRAIRLTLDGESLHVDATATSTWVTVDGIPVSGAMSFPSVDGALSHVLTVADRIVLLLHLQQPVATDGGSDLGLVGHSAAMAQVRREISQVMDLDVPVLVRGETGTGKELVARAIHHHGNRRRNPFVPVNMGGIPSSLASAELFGAARGAYTGSSGHRTGFFRQARDGTLFLDEIAETPAEIQVLLLRALEDGEVQPLGSDVRVGVDTRLITATDADLEEGVRRERFRSPLLHRLSGFQIWIPPLRQRRDDLGRLLIHFLRETLRETGEMDRLRTNLEDRTVWLPASLVDRLARFSWPGNVRQLRHVARQLIITNRGRPTLRMEPTVERLLVDNSLARKPADLDGPGPRPYRKAAEIEDQELTSALRTHRWKLEAAARQLRISRGALYRLVDRHPTFRKAVELDRQEIGACHERCAGDLDRMVDDLQVSKRGLQRRMTQLGLDFKKTDAA